MLTTKEIYTLFNTQLSNDLADKAISKVSTDSRDLGASSLFIALRGDSFDGHAFIDKAFADGAVLVIAEYIPSGVEASRPIIIVPDSLRAYQDIAAYYRNKFDIPIIGITGSNGKTSTKDIVASCIASSMPVLKNYANFNNDIGVPKTLLQLTDEHCAAIVEMGMRGLGQIARLTEIARPHIAIITSITPTHIELLGSLDNIARAKAEIFKDFTENDTVILNYDNLFTRNMKPNCRRIYFGLSAGADITAREIIYKENCTAFTCVDNIRGKAYTVCTPLLGEHNVTNTLAALAVASVMNLDLEKTLAGLANTEVSQMRQSIEKYDSITVINDAYNASPVSMHMGLKTLQSIAQGRRSIAVVGDMLELGEFAQNMHAQVADQCKECDINIVITYGSLMQFAQDRLHVLDIAGRHFEDKSALADYVKSIVKQDDVLLFKGSRGMKMEELIPMIFN